MCSFEGSAFDLGSRALLGGSRGLDCCENREGTSLVEVALKLVRGGICDAVEAGAGLSDVIVLAPVVFGGVLVFSANPF